MPLGRLRAAAYLGVQYAGPLVDGDDSVRPGVNAPTVRFNSTWYSTERRRNPSRGPADPGAVQARYVSKLCDALDRARTILTASQKRYKDDFDKKVRSRPVVGVGNFVHVDRPHRSFTSVERGTRAQGTTGTDELSVKLLPRTEGPFCVCNATDTTVFIEQDGVENGVSMDRVTKMQRGPGDTFTPAPPTELDEEAATPGAEYVVDRIVRHLTARGGVEYKVR